MFLNEIPQEYEVLDDGSKESYDSFEQMLDPCVNQGLNPYEICFINTLPSCYFFENKYSPCGPMNKIWHDKNDLDTHACWKNKKHFKQSGLKHYLISEGGFCQGKKHGKPEFISTFVH